jgi:hypothetical protein
VNEDKLMRRMAKQDRATSKTIQKRNVAEKPTHLDMLTGRNVIIHSDVDQFRRPTVIFSDGSMVIWNEKVNGELTARFIQIKK